MGRVLKMDSMNKLPVKWDEVISSDQVSGTSKHTEIDGFIGNLENVLKSNENEDAEGSTAESNGLAASEELEMRGTSRSKPSNLLRDTANAKNGRFGGAKNVVGSRANKTTNGHESQLTSISKVSVASDSRPKQPFSHRRNSTTTNESQISEDNTLKPNIVQIKAHVSKEFEKSNAPLRIEDESESQALMEDMRLKTVKKVDQHKTEGSTHSSSYPTWLLFLTIFTFFILRITGLRFDELLDFRKRQPNSNFHVLNEILMYI